VSATAYKVLANHADAEVAPTCPRSIMLFKILNCRNTIVKIQIDSQAYSMLQTEPTIAMIREPHSGGDKSQKLLAVVCTCFT